MDVTFSYLNSLLNIVLHLSNQGKNTEETRSKSAIAIDDCQFHQCVKLSKFETEHAIRYCVCASAWDSKYFFEGLYVVFKNIVGRC